MVFKFFAQPNEEVTSQVITDLIKDHKTTRDAMVVNWENYIGQGLPIASRTFTDTTKINRKLSADFRGAIVDSLVGFMFGNPVTYTTENDKANKYLQDFLKSNSVDDVDMETGTRSSAVGTSGRLLYIDRLGKERMMYVPGWECIFVYDRSLTEVQYALRYYEMEDVVEGKTGNFITKVEIYDNEKITFYTSNGMGLYVLDTSVPKNPLVHNFDGIPLIEFENNDERQSDFEKVRNTIDSYDRSLSDVQNELEEQRLAYMVFEGVHVDAAFMVAARNSGAIEVPVGGKADYLIKEINDKVLENHFKRLKEDIYGFSKVVDVNSENFIGSGTSGETRKWLMLAMELKAAKKETKYRKSLTKMFAVLGTLWKKKGIDIDETNINVVFDRLYPQEMLIESEIQANLKGVISDDTRLSLFAPVKDVKKEQELLKEQRKNEPDPDPNNPDPNPNGHD